MGIAQSTYESLDTRLERGIDGPTYVITPRNDLMGGMSTRSLCAAVRDICAEAAGSDKKPYIVIDLGNVVYINSTGLETLAASDTAIHLQNGSFVIARFTRLIHNLFIITKLAYIFDCYDTVDDALMKNHGEKP